MARPFLYNILTLDGAALIARATAANPLVITGTKSCTLAASSGTDLASKPLSWYNGRTGAIHSVSASSNAARIDARYEPEGTRQTLKTVCILAKIDGDAESVILCAKSDPNADITLPGAGDISQALDFEFALIVNADGEIEVTPGASASQADLDRLVSAHVAGDSSQGEAQTVRGEKTFLNGIVVKESGGNAGIMPYTDRGANIGVSQTLLFNTVNSAVLDTLTLYVRRDVDEHYDEGVIIDEYGIKCTPTNTFDIGNSSYKFKDAYFSGTVNVGGLSGTAPSDDTATPTYIKLPIGGIVVAIFNSNNISGFSPTITTLLVGDEVTLTQGAQGAEAVKTGTWRSDGTWGTAGNRLLPDGTYVLLTSPATPANSSDMCPILLQRIA